MQIGHAIMIASENRWETLKNGEPKMNLSGVWGLKCRVDGSAFDTLIFKCVFDLGWLI